LVSFLLVDDQHSVRQALRMQVELGLGQTVVGEAGSVSDALALAHQLQPDVIILDVVLPDGDGISAIADLRGAAPHAALLVLSVLGDERTKERAMLAGADAFATKDTAEAFDSTLRGILRRFNAPI
jgi:DNA-binding NarL/FixJ family response regulator